MHNSMVDIEFDPDKAQTNLKKHKVSFPHAEQALRDPFALTIEDPDSEGEQRFITLGMDSLGRELVVIYTPRGERIRLISARKASRGETEHYHAERIRFQSRKAGRSAALTWQDENHHHAR